MEKLSADDAPPLYQLLYHSLKALATPHSHQHPQQDFQDAYKRQMGQIIENPPSLTLSEDVIGEIVRSHWITKKEILYINSFYLALFNHFTNPKLISDPEAIPSENYGGLFRLLFTNLTGFSCHNMQDILSLSLNQLKALRKILNTMTNAFRKEFENRRQLITPDLASWSFPLSYGKTIVSVHEAPPRDEWSDAMKETTLKERVKELMERKVNDEGLTFGGVFNPWLLNVPYFIEEQSDWQLFPFNLSPERKRFLPHEGKSNLFTFFYKYLPRYPAETLERIIPVFLEYDEIISKALEERRQLAQKIAEKAHGEADKPVTLDEDKKKRIISRFSERALYAMLHKISAYPFYNFTVNDVNEILMKK